MKEISKMMNIMMIMETFILKTEIFIQDNLKTVKSMERVLY